MSLSYPRGEAEGERHLYQAVEVDNFPLKREGPLVGEEDQEGTAHQNEEVGDTGALKWMEGGLDTFCPLGEGDGELHLHTAVVVVGSRRRGEPCLDEVVGGLVGRVRQKGEGALVPLSVREASSGEGDPLKLGVPEGEELVLKEATSLQPYGRKN